MRIPDAWSSSARLQGRHLSRRLRLSLARRQRDRTKEQREPAVLPGGIPVAIRNPSAHHDDEFQGGDSKNRYKQLFELVTRLTEADTLQSTLDEVLEASMSLVGADAGYIRLFERNDVDPLKDQYPFVVHRGISDAYIKYFSAIPSAVDENGRLELYEGRRVIIEDMTTHPPFRPHLDIVLAERYTSLQGTPMMSANASTSLGVIGTYFLKAYTPPQETFETLDLYAELAASAIERHQQISELEHRQRILTTMTCSQRSLIERLGAQLRRAGQRAYSLEPEEVRRLTNSLAEEIGRSIDYPAQGAVNPQQLSQVEARNLPYGMSGREIEVLLHMWQGLGDKQIAQEVGISRFTVHKHVRSILQKMNVEGRTQAGIRAEREGLFRFMPAVWNPALKAS
jgi:DNA-binding NarL/FixJ family response regulator